MNYTARHLIAAHAVVLRLQQNPRIRIEQIDAKDIIAEALANAERGVLVATLATPEPDWEAGAIGMTLAVYYMRKQKLDPVTSGLRARQVLADVRGAGLLLSLRETPARKPRKPAVKPVARASQRSK